MTLITPNSKQYYRPTEPPSLWIVFILGSVAIHLLAIGILHLLIGGGGKGKVASTSVPVEIITVKPINQPPKAQVIAAKPALPTTTPAQVKSNIPISPPADTSNLNSKFPLEKVPPQLEQPIKTAERINSNLPFRENRQPSLPLKPFSLPKPPLKTQKSSSTTSTQPRQQQPPKKLTPTQKFSPASPQIRQPKPQRKLTIPQASKPARNPSSVTTPQQQTQQQRELDTESNINSNSEPFTTSERTQNSPLDPFPNSSTPSESSSSTATGSNTSASSPSNIPVPLSTPTQTATQPTSPNSSSSPFAQGTETQTLPTTSDSEGGGILMATLVRYELANGGRDNPDEPAKPKQNKMEFSSISYPSQAKQNTNQNVVLQAVLQIDDIGKPTVQSARLLEGDNTIDATQLAAEIVGDWKFQPAKQAGQAVYSLLEVTIRVAPKSN